MADTTLLTLDELMDKAYAFQSSLINGTSPDDDSIPTFIAQSNDGQIFMYGTPFDGAESKQAICRILREEFKKKGIVRYVLATEAWVSIRKVGDGPNDTPPSEDPQRQDVLMVIGVDKSGHVACQRATIAVTDANKRCVDKPDIDDGATNFSGRMTSLLQE